MCLNFVSQKGTYHFADRADAIASSSDFSELFRIAKDKRVIVRRRFVQTSILGDSTCGPASERTGRAPAMPGPTENPTPARNRIARKQITATEEEEPNDGAKML